MNNQKFYVTETTTTHEIDGANCDIETITISTEPARNNFDNDVCLSGWCGSTNDLSTYAHGEYETEEQARAAIASKFGDVRELNSYDNPDEFGETDVAVFRPGKYEKLSLDASEAWVYDAACNDIKADATDADLEKYLAEYEKSANNEMGGTLHSSTLDYLKELRDEMDED